MTKLIPLTQGKFTIVDDDDYEKLSKYKWHALSRKGGLWHAARNRSSAEVREGLPRHIYMHREIINAPAGILVDHKNGNGLDNRRENLRHATKTENARNSRTKAGKYKGVGFHRSSGLWSARIVVNKKVISLGYHHTPEEAARAYDNACKNHFGEFARPNFSE